MWRTALIATGLLALTLLPQFAIALPAPSFEGLGFQSVRMKESQAHGVSADGSVVVGYAYFAHFGSVRREAFRWTEETGLVNLGAVEIEDSASTAWAVSADGNSVVGRSEFGTPRSTGEESFLWTATGGMVGLGDIPDGRFHNAGYDVSDAGDVVVGYAEFSDGTQAPMRWTPAGGMESLPYLEPIPRDPGSKANAVSGDGTIVVGIDWQAGEAFRWTELGGIVALPELPGGCSGDASARDISSDGNVIVGFCRIGGRYAPVRWTDAGVQDLGGDGNPGQLNLIGGATATSFDGSVVVGFADGDGFVWYADHGTLSLKEVIKGFGLDADGWSFLFPTAVSDDGTTVVGHGLNLDGNNEAFRAVLPVFVPEPDPSVNLAVAVVTLGMLGRRRRSYNSSPTPSLPGMISRSLEVPLKKTCSLQPRPPSESR